MICDIDYDILEYKSDGLERTDIEKTSKGEWPALSNKTNKYLKLKKIIILTMAILILPLTPVYSALQAYSGTAVAYVTKGQTGTAAITPNGEDLVFGTAGTAIAYAATIIQTPMASLEGGSYFGAQTLKLTCKTKGAAVYYTLDGSRPGTKSLKYSKPIKIKESCVVRAIAVKSGHKSKELTSYYTINTYADLDDVERYHLAIVKNEIAKLSETDQKICLSVKEILGEIITDGMSDYDKVKAVHDYIINHCTYDTEHGTDIDSIPDASFHVEGVILNGTAVCQGYAETFQLFMDLLNIQNLLVTGTGDGVSHGWNLVFLDGNWYHVDTTWDDPISDSGVQSLSYHYFLVNDEQMALDHVWTKDDYPVAASDELMYKIYENSIISSVSDYETKFTELYQQGATTITVLYPEDKMPDMSFYNRLTGKNSYKYNNPVKFGKYYIFTVYLE